MYPAFIQFQYGLLSSLWGKHTAGGIGYGGGGGLMMSEDRKCPKCGADLRLVEDNSRISVGGVPDTSVVLLWKCPNPKCEYAERAD